MEKLFTSAKLRLLLLPLLGVAGTLAALAWRAGYDAFCAGIPLPGVL